MKWRSIIAAIIALLAVPANAIELPVAAPATAAEKVSLQLRWHHQFQFAGYYAAKEQGFYRNAGLDVTIVAGEPGREPVREVLAGRAQYGTTNHELLLNRLQSEPLVALSAIFQHSPAVFLVRQDSGIRSPQDLVGRSVMTFGGGADIRLIAMLRAEGVDPGKVKFEKSSYDINDLAEGNIDAFNSYLTNEPFFMERKGIPVTALNPATYGIDFYSDILFTTENEIENHPDRVKRFRAASLRGWEYAMANPEEIIDLILTEYSGKKTRGHLRFEADAMRDLVLPGRVEMGHMNPGRWKHMADTFVGAGLVEPGYSLEGFIYDPKKMHDGPLVFLGDAGFAPYEFIEDGKPTGANVDFLKALGEVLGRPVELRLYQWADAQARFNNGEGDALTMVAINEIRNKLYDFTQPTFTFKFSLFTKSGLVEEFNVDDFSSRRIAVKRGGGPRFIMENSHPEAELVFVDNALEGFQLLLKADVDGVIEDRLVGEYTLRESELDGISALSRAVATRTAHISVIKGNAHLVTEMSRAVTKLKLAGKLDEISRRWSGIAIAQSIQITVGSELDYPPYALVAKDGRAHGFSVDLMKAVCEVMGIDVTFRVGPWSEVLTALENGEIDALPLVSYSDEREKVLDFTPPHTSTHAVTFKRKGDPPIETEDDLRGKSIITMRAEDTHDYIVTNRITDRLVLTDTIPEALRLLASGENDYAMAPRLVGLLAIKELGLTNLEVTGPLLSVYGRGYGFAVKEGNTELLGLLNQGLSIVKQTGRYDEIYEKWFGLVDPKGIPTAVIIRYLTWGAVGVIILIGLPLGWSISLRRTVRRQTMELQADITARKEVERDLAAFNENLEQRVEERTAELRSAQESLLRKERLATLGELTGTVAHELRNPLGVISTSVALIQRKSTDTNLDLKGVLGRIDRSIVRCDNIITELLDFARAKGLQTETMALDPWLTGVLDEQRIPEGIKVNWNAQTNGATLRFDPDELRRAVINVVDNACQAMTDETGEPDRLAAGELTIATRANGERIEIEISDTGAGIPADILPRILEPLFSTKTFGTGLGLPTVQRIMENHGGGLEIESEAGQGTRAVLWLPPQGGDNGESRA